MGTLSNAGSGSYQVTPDPAAVLVAPSSIRTPSSSATGHARASLKKVGYLWQERSGVGEEYLRHRHRDGG